MNNQDQIDYWNGKAGQKWVDQSERLDAMLAPFADHIVDVANFSAGEAVLDVGCGAGALTLKAAAQVGAEKGALGVDVSAPLLNLARQRAAELGLPARFVQADASSYYSPNMNSDVLTSRFGIMFFTNPNEAFANLRQSMSSNGRMACMCWQALDKNDWAFAPLRAAMPFLTGAPPASDPTAPGPFALQDRDRTAKLLEEAGWKDVHLDPVELMMQLPGDDLASSAAFMIEMGPLSRLIASQNLDPAPIEASLRDLLSNHQNANGKIEMAAAAWMVTARSA